MLALSLAPVPQPYGAREGHAPVKLEPTGASRLERTPGASAAAGDSRDAA